MSPEEERWIAIVLEEGRKQALSARAVKRVECGRARRGLRPASDCSDAGRRRTGPALAKSARHSA